MSYDPQRAIQTARAFADAGYHEGPNNRNEFSYWQYGNSYNPWCDSFVCFVAYKAGYRFPTYSACKDRGDYNVGTHHQNAVREGTWRDRSYRAHTGDLVVLSWDVPDQHIEMVDADNGATLLTVGGNTNDRCARRQRSRQNVVGFIALTESVQVAKPTVPKPKVASMFNPPLQIVGWTLFDHPKYGRCVVGTDAQGHLFCEPPEAYMGSPYDDRTGLPKDYWAGHAAATVDQPNAGEKHSGKAYVVVATDSPKHRYAFPEGH